MNDNPYKESMERERVQNAKPMGRMFFVGCLLLYAIWKRLAVPVTDRKNEM